MTTPTVNGRASAASPTTDSHQHTITLPASISAGERLLVVFACDGGPTHLLDEVYSGTRWERVAYLANSTTVSGSVWSKVAEGGDALRILTPAAEQSSHVSFRISAANSVAATGATGSGINSDPPLHTITGASPAPDPLWIAARCGNSTTVATAAPAGFANLQTQAAGGTGGASTNTAELSATADESENPGAFTSGSEFVVTFTIAVYADEEGRARASQAVAEVVSSEDARLRLTQLVAEVVSSGVGSAPAVGGGMLIIAT